MGNIHCDGLVGLQRILCARARANHWTAGAGAVGSGMQARVAGASRGLAEPRGRCAGPRRASQGGTGQPSASSDLAGWDRFARMYHNSQISVNRENQNVDNSENPVL